MCVKWGQSHCELRQSCEKCYQQQRDIQTHSQFTDDGSQSAISRIKVSYCASENRTYFKVGLNIFELCLSANQDYKMGEINFGDLRGCKWAILNQAGSDWNLQWIDKDNKQLRLLKFSGKDNHRHGSKVLCSLMILFCIMPVLMTQNNSFCNNSQRVEPPSKESGKTRSLC